MFSQHRYSSLYFYFYYVSEPSGWWTMYCNYPYEGHRAFGREEWCIYHLSSGRWSCLVFLLMWMLHTVNYALYLETITKTFYVQTNLSFLFFSSSYFILLILCIAAIKQKSFDVRCKVDEVFFLCQMLLFSGTLCRLWWMVPLLQLIGSSPTFSSEWTCVRDRMITIQVLTRYFLFLIYYRDY